MSTPVLNLPSARLDEFAAPAGEFVERDPEDTERQLVGDSVILNSRLNILDLFAFMTRRPQDTLELMEEGDGFDEAEETLVVTPGSEVSGREGEVFGVWDDDSDRLENSLEVVVSPADHIFGDIALETP